MLLSPCPLFLSLSKFFILYNCISLQLFFRLICYWALHAWSRIRYVCFYVSADLKSLWKFGLSSPFHIQGRAGPLCPRKRDERFDNRSVWHIKTCTLVNYIQGKAQTHTCFSVWCWLRIYLIHSPSTETLQKKQYDLSQWHSLLNRAYLLCLWFFFPVAYRGWLRLRLTG